MDADLFARSFRRNAAIVAMQAEGLTHEDALIQPPFNVNCFNWVVGHLVVSRLQLFQALDPQGGWEWSRYARYERESDPVTADGPGVLPLEELMAGLAESQQRLEALLARYTPEDLDEEVTAGGRSATRTARLQFAFFHDAYHTGQTDLLRQLSGKADKII